MTGPGTDDESDDPPEERDDPRNPTDRAGPGDDADGRDRPTDDARPGDGTPADDETGAGGAEPAGDGTAAGASPDAGSDAGAGVAADADATPTPDSSAAAGSGPEGPPIPGDDDEQPEFDNPVDWFLHTNDAFVTTVRDVGSSLLTVAVLGLVLFAVSGIWPPLVAVESGSMEPHMHKNDLVFIVEEGRFVGDSAQPGTGVVTHYTAERNDGYWSFGDYGNVIVFEPDGSDRRTPIIHRARFHVEEGENWVDPPDEGGTGKADAAYLGSAESCTQVRTCPAPHDGFVTLGDANNRYDQVGGGGNSNVVKPDWIRGKAKVRIPLLGWIRLQFAQLATGFGTAGPTSLGALRLQLGAVFAGVGAVVARRRGVL